VHFFEIKPRDFGNEVKNGEGERRGFWGSGYGLISCQNTEQRREKGEEQKGNTE
jgi:hypothetical protein